MGMGLELMRVYVEKGQVEQSEAPKKDNESK